MKNRNISPYHQPAKKLILVFWGVFFFFFFFSTEEQKKDKIEFINTFVEIKKQSHRFFFAGH